MKTRIKIIGSILKSERVVPLQSNRLENTCVLEASNPYANYYGRLPRSLKPNSLFLLTRKFYFLEEVMGYAMGVENCLKNSVDFGSAVLDFNGHQIPAIRIKNFPDYKQLGTLQQCLMDQGVEFASKCEINGPITARISKIFHLYEIEKGIFIDTKEPNKGYVKVENKILPEQFNAVLNRIKNNSDCHLFDAVQGELIMNGEIVEMVRVFSEGIDEKLLLHLKCQFRELVVSEKVYRETY